MPESITSEFQVRGRLTEDQIAEKLQDILTNAATVIAETGRRPCRSTDLSWRHLDIAFSKGTFGSQYTSLAKFLDQNGMPRIPVFSPTPTLTLDDLIQSIEETLAGKGNCVQFLHGYFKYGPLKNELTGCMVDKAIKAETVIGLEPGLYKDLNDLCVQMGYKISRKPYNLDKNKVTQAASSSQITKSNDTTYVPKEDINQIRKFAYKQSLVPVCF